MSFLSEVRHVGSIAFPKFTGTRVMMLPFRLGDLDTLPLPHYRNAVATLIKLAPVQHGTAYLTIDEAVLKAGETHRRPGLHVDGIGPDGREAGWGGGGKYGSSGMLLAASHFGCMGWNQVVDGYPGPNGDCGHLHRELDPKKSVTMLANEVYFCGPLGVHIPVEMAIETPRQLVRLSMPNDCPWYEGYTANPMVKAEGPIHPRREVEMGYRP